MPDANLRAAINKKYLYKAEKSPIYRHELENMLGSVNLESLNITDITGLEHCINIDGLYLTGNKIKDISPLSNLVKLTGLGLAGCNISDISALSGLKKMGAIYLNDNKISDISALSGMERLWMVYLYNNEISDISAISRLENFEYLYINNNRVSDISVLSGMERMRELNLNDNKISDISVVSRMKNLGSLYISNNRISDLSPLGDRGDKLKTLEASGQVIEREVIATSGFVLVDNIVKNNYGTSIKPILDNGAAYNEFTQQVLFKDVIEPSQKQYGFNKSISIAENKYAQFDGTVINNIKLVENSAPVIDGAGDVTLKISEVDSFNKLAGITASEVFEKKTEKDIVITGEIVKPEAGQTKTSVLSYTLVGTEGLVTTVQRNITVTNEKPVFEGLSEVTLVKGQPFNARTGVTATDLEDGNLTSSIVFPEGNLVVGVNNLKYSSTDSDGNVTTETRKVTLLDNLAPTIEGATNITIGVGEVDSFDKLKGITVGDDNDNLTLEELVVTGEIVKPAAGTNQDSVITYVATEAQGLETTVTRTITVTNQKPTISGLTDLTIVASDVVNLETGVTATDLEDGDITAQIKFPTTTKRNMLTKIKNAIKNERTGQLEPGVHNLEYVVTDSDGNTTTETRKVTVQGNQAPVMVGVTDTTIAVGEVDSFNKLEGITVSDDHDDLKATDIVVTGTIEKPVGGKNKDSILTYTLTDSKGAKTVLTRTITVTNQKPTINGLTEVTIKDGEAFDKMAGVTATDLEDGNLTSKIIPPIVNLKVGVNELQYIVGDSNGNVVSETRIINVEKNEAPIITGATDLTIGIGEVDTFNKLEGIAVSDDHDTSLATSDIVITGEIAKPAVGEEKASKLTYTITDSLGAKTVVTRTITVTNEKAVIDGLTDISISKGENLDLRTEVTASDLEDGNITKDIVFPEAIATVGTHNLQYSVTDSDGNVTTATRVVNIFENAAPVINGATAITIGIGEVDRFDSLAGITVSDDHDDLNVKDIVVTGTLVKPEPGTNKDSVLTYTLTDSKGKETVVKRTITVTNQKPTINGLTEVTIKDGEEFDKMAGVTATDLEDGNITSKIIPPIVNLKVGVNELQYIVGDSNGNVVSEIKIVNVEKNEAPIITGATDVTIGIGKVDNFDKLAGITVSDDHDTDILPTDIVVTGEILKPAVGEEKTSKLTYTLTDSLGVKTVVTRTITVTNEKPVIEGLNDITISKDEVLDLRTGVSARDLEDGDITSKITFPEAVNTVGTHKVQYSVTDSDGNNTTKERVVNITASGFKAGLNKSKGGIMLSTTGNGLRLFTAMENIDLKEVGTYYITTASNKNETALFEVKSTVDKADKSQIKTSIEFEELAKLTDNTNTKLYVKRVVKGKEPEYTELGTGEFDLTKGLSISDGKIKVDVSDIDSKVILNKTMVSENIIEQGTSNIQWNDAGMVVEGRPTVNGSVTAFENAKVSMMFKDLNGNYINVNGTRVEVRGTYRDGKYQVTIPYEILDNVHSFELRIIGANIQISEPLEKGTIQEFSAGAKNGKIYELSADKSNIINLEIKQSTPATSELTNARVTKDKTTGLEQFSINGSVIIPEIENIDSSVKYTIVAKKGQTTLFEQAATKVNNSGNYNNFKTNIAVDKLVKANLSANDEVSLELNVEYKGNIKNIDLSSTKAAISITDKASKQTFEMTSKDGKAIIVKK